MDFSDDLGSATRTGIEGALCFLICIIAYKIYRMKLHTFSRCCKDSLIIETMNNPNSSSNLEFTTNLKNEKKDEKKDENDNDNLESSII